LRANAAWWDTRGRSGSRFFGRSSRFGIYTFIWTYKTQEEIKRYCGNGVGGVIGLVIYILISPVTFFLVPSEVRYMYEDLDGERSPVRGIYGLWFLLPLIGHLIWFIQVQGALNRYWEGKGAHAP